MNSENSTEKTTSNAFIDLFGNSTIQKFYAICELGATFVYTAMWIIGGFLYPGYSHIRDDVSTLMSASSPIKELMDTMSIISAILGVIFYIGLFISFKKKDFPVIGPFILIFVGIFTILTSFVFFLDEGGEMISVEAHIHFILVMGMALFTMVAMLSMWRGLKNRPNWKNFSFYALISFIITLISGGIAAFTIGTDLMGIGERFAILSTQQFFVVTALKLMKESTS